MVTVGDRPILWHIMAHYARFGHKDFVVALGYKGYVIKEYFANYSLHNSDFSVDLREGQVRIHSRAQEDWQVTLVDTGLDTMTGGRLLRLRSLLEEPFLLTYGDGLSDVDMDALVDHHTATGAMITVTAVNPLPRFGALDVDNGQVVSFREKPITGKERINGGFFVVSPDFFVELTGDDCVMEGEPLSRVAADGRMSAFLHDGFWMPMDTVRDRDQLEALWSTGHPPWVRS